MKSPVIYTFRTSKYLDDFAKNNIKVFVFGNLKQDLVIFQKILNHLQPSRIIGLAEVKMKTKIEGRAINSFGSKRRINKTGQDSYEMHTPPDLNFKVSNIGTNSFCNWTMYRVNEIIDPTKTKFSFVHFNKKDLEELIDFIKR